MRRLALSLALASAPVLQAQEFSQVKIMVVPVAAGIYMLQGAGGNIGLSVGDETFVIDDQYAPLTQRIRDAITTVTSKPVRFVVNTHWHGDHSGGNENMAIAGAIIVAHENVRRRMSTEQFIEAFKSKVPASPAAALPVITFTDAISFYVNGDSIHVVHVDRAHTDGDALIGFRKANVVHMGDTYFNGMYPFIDVSSGGSIDGMIIAANRVLAMSNDSTRIIPGHGPLSTKASLRKYRDLLVDVRGRIARLVAQRRSLAQIIAAKPLADYDSTWGTGFIKPDQFVTIVHSSLTRKPTARAGTQHHER